MARISKDPVIRKQELLDIAQKLFILKGYEGTSVRDILNEVGGAPGMFYYYFSSKEEIYKEAMEQYIANYVIKLNRILCNRALTISERIQELFQMIRCTFKEYLFASGSYDCKESPDCGVIVSFRILDSIADSVENFILEAIERGFVKNSAIQSQNVKQFALFILYGVYGVLHDGCQNGISMELIERNMNHVIPLISDIISVPVEVLVKGSK